MTQPFIDYDILLIYYKHRFQAQAVKNHKTYSLAHYALVEEDIMKQEAMSEYCSSYRFQ